MFAQSHSPEQLAPSELDAYLAQGWFRMGQAIFTTNFVRFKGEIYSTIWLRILLNDYIADRTQVKLFKQNAVFRTAIQPVHLTTEKEELYVRYQLSLSFQTSESLQHLLFGNKDTKSIYTTYEVTVHDGDRLIAIGFFDIGKTAASGITSVYDPAYKKYSLGKYLIYQKIQYCLQLNLRYFYPGYFVPGYPYFDYKLSIGREALQFLQLNSQHWVTIKGFFPESIPYQVMYDKLANAQKLLSLTNLESSIMKYEYFDANLIPDLGETKLFDFPLFLFRPAPSEEDIHLTVVYDVRDARYHLLVCLPLWQPEVTHSDTMVYSSCFLKVFQELHSTTVAEEITDMFFKLVKNNN